VHMLIKTAAQRHIELLKAAADRQNRLCRRDGGAQQRQGGGVANFIQFGAGPRRCASIAGIA